MAEPVDTAKVPQEFRGNAAHDLFDRSYCPIQRLRSFHTVEHGGQRGGAMVCHDDTITRRVADKSEY
jgi:hypothetical protein